MVNEWTSNDVPSVESLDLYNKRPDLDISGKHFGAAVAFRAMVKHLNTHHPKPDEETYVRVLDQSAEIDDLKADRDRWRRAHEIVEQERDQARESLRRLRDETDFDLFTVRDQLKQCRGEREQMTRDRDEWKARAEAAEARTAPAVTRADIEKSLRKAFTEDLGLARTTDAVWSLVSGADPAVHVVRESELPELHLRNVRNFNLADGQTVFRDATDEDIARAVVDVARDLRYVIAAHRAIEAGADVDPVDAKARDLWETTISEGAEVVHWESAHEDAQEQFRILARHWPEADR